MRFFDYPKGPRHGEVYRHQALRQASGRIVCYLSDDDVYLPHHVEEMSALLREADFAHAFAVEAHPDGSVSSWSVDLNLPIFRFESLQNANRIPLSAGAHTLAFYRQLPHGWTTAPQGIPTDLYMWQQFIRDPRCRFRAGRRPTVVVFPSPHRLHLSSAERVEEMQRWSADLTDEGEILHFTERVLAAKVTEAIELQATFTEAQHSDGKLWQGAGAQVFFPVPGVYSEQHSTRFPVRVGAWQKFSAAYPQVEHGLPARIDPAERPCLIELGGIRLCASDGSVLWSLGEDNSHELQITGTAVPISWGAIVKILSDGIDPQVVLPAVAAAASGDEVRLEFSLRQETDLGRLTESFSDYLQALAP